MMTSSNGNIFRVTVPLCGEFTSQRSVTRSFDVFFGLGLNKQSRRWWFETPTRSLWRHRNVRSWPHLLEVYYRTRCHPFSVLEDESWPQNAPQANSSLNQRLASCVKKKMTFRSVSVFTVTNLLQSNLVRLWLWKTKFVEIFRNIV